MIYSFAEYELDTERCELRCDGQRVHVEPQVFDVLAALIRERERVVSRDELLDRVWGHHFVTDATVSSRVMAARRAIGDSGAQQRWIATLRGRGFRFVGEVDAREPPPPELPPAASPERGYVGRARELRRLRAALTDALARRRRLVLVTGEVGAGKTTLVERFLREAAAVPGLRSAQGQCIEHRGAGEPYLPVLEALARLCRIEGGDDVVSVLRGHAPTWLLQLPWLLSEDERARLESSLLGATPERMLREMLEALEALTAKAPLLLVLEDLQWSDPSTLDLLGALIRRAEPARLLVIVTSRSAAPRAVEALRGLVADRRFGDRCEELSLGPLAEDEVAELLAGMDAEPGLPQRLAGPLHARTEGNPLFLHSLLEDWCARGALRRAGGQLRLYGDLDGLREGMPDDLRALIEEQLARLEGPEQDLLEAASVAGMTFSAAAVAAALGERDEEVERRATGLARAQRWLCREGSEAWPDGTLAERFRLVHHLHREVLYERLPAGRRARLHARVARRLEAGHGSAADVLATALAEHYLRGGEDGPAVRWLRRAAERALVASAHREAVGHLRDALEIVRRRSDLPDAAAHELALQALLGPALVATEGWRAPEAEHAFTRARELCQATGDRERLSNVLYGLATLLEYRGEYPASQLLIERRLELSPDTADAAAVVASHELLACSLFHQGAFAQALAHADAGLRAHREHDRHPAASALGEHPAVNCHGWAALALWFLEQPEAALERAHAGVMLAREPGRGYSLANALVALARVHQHRGEPAAAGTAARDALALAGAQGFAYVAAAAGVLAGWATTSLGEHDEGLQALRSALTAHEATGALMDRPYFLGLLAEAALTAGRAEEAADAVGQALALLVPGRGFFYEHALRRLDKVLQQQGVR